MLQYALILCVCSKIYFVNVGAKVTVFVDEENTLQALYFQAKNMIDVFQSYPELLFIDATYKLNDLYMPLYVLLCIDGNGESEIVCLWLVHHEDKATLTKLMSEFKKHNKSWSDIQCIMSDKDMVERDVLKEEIPSASLLICLFHTLCSMKRELSCDKLGISLAEKTMCLELMSKMAYSQTAEMYTTLYDELKQCAPPSVIEYFDKNWHCIHEQWVDGLKKSNCNFMNRTNNRLESINQKLKMVITRYSGMTDFFRDLMKCLVSLNMERDHRAIELTSKRRITEYEEGSIFDCYAGLLTPYAFGFLKSQLESVQKVTIAQDIDEDSCSITTAIGSITVSINCCSCGFFYFYEVTLPSHVCCTSSQGIVPIS